jgi:hypothetical protein
VISIHVEEPLALVPDDAWPDPSNLLRRIPECNPVDLWIRDLLEKISVAADPQMLR